MRHGKRFNHLSRKTAHRKSMLSNMASSLILHKRISTTLPKAKELRKYVEPLITKAKTDTTHSRRIVFSYLQNKESVQVLFNEVADRAATRPGGYTRILKTGNRLGDNAEMCFIELVDYNEAMLEEAEAGKTKTRRSRRRRRGGKGKSEQQEKATAATETRETPPEEVKEEKTKETEEKAEAQAEEKVEEKEEKEEKKEAKAEEKAEEQEEKKEVKAEAQEEQEEKEEEKKAKPEDKKEEGEEGDEEKK